MAFAWNVVETESNKLRKPAKNTHKTNKTFQRCRMNALLNYEYDLFVLLEPLSGVRFERVD